MDPSAEEKQRARNRRFFRTLTALESWHQFRLRLFAEGIAVGILGGLCISLFRFLLEKAEEARLLLYRTYLVPAAESGNLLPLLAWALFLFAAGYVLFRMLRYAPLSGGSGIPQVKGVIMGLMKMKWFRILWVKIFGGALGIGIGLSLGREGPSIQIGAAAAQGLSRFLGRTRLEERFLITSGAGAGLAAAFNAPLAGTLFALEELHRNFSGAVLLPTMAGAVTASIVTRFFFGESTSFHFAVLPPLPVQDLIWAVLLAVSAGFLGILFNAGLLRTGRFYSLPLFRGSYSRILFALFCAAALGFFLPSVLGGGNRLVDVLAGAPYSLSFLLLLLAGKYILTLISYGCGVPGGFFLPLLVLGALLGSAEGTALSALGLLNASYLPHMIILGMAALFASSVRSPITGTVLILEMTGDFNHLMVLALVSALAYVTAELLGGEPIYDALLKKSLTESPAPDAEKRKDILLIPVGSGSLLDCRKVSDIPPLPHTVLMEIKRGGQSLIPDPDTKLRTGDFLCFLTENEQAEMLREMGREQVPPSHIGK